MRKRKWFHSRVFITTVKVVIAALGAALVAVEEFVRRLGTNNRGKKGGGEAKKKS